MLLKFVMMIVELDGHTVLESRGQFALYFALSLADRVNIKYLRDHKSLASHRGKLLTMIQSWLFNPSQE